MTAPTGTKVYGASDDLIEIEGDVLGEVGVGDSDKPCLLMFSDGTMLSVKYGKPGLGGVWQVSLVKRGTLFDSIEQCDDEDAEVYSDVALFRPGLAYGYAAKEWEEIR